MNAAEWAVLEEIVAGLRRRGWADHLTPQGLIGGWKELAQSVGRYAYTVDDYTNVTSRDALELMIADSPHFLREKLSSLVEQADRDFRERTVDDGGNAIGRFFRIDETSGWWWKRRPFGGPLSDYLDGRR